MSKNPLFLLIISAILSSCSLGKQGVYYNEMAEPPQVKLENKTLIILTNNSYLNSALLIYKIEAKANTDKKDLVITAKQALLKKPRNSFEIDLQKLGINDFSGWTIIWVDPDGKKTAMKI